MGGQGQTIGKLRLRCLATLSGLTPTLATLSGLTPTLATLSGLTPTLATLNGLTPTLATLSGLSATTLAIFVVPVLFVLITKISYGRKVKRLAAEHKEIEDIDRKIIAEGRD